MALTGVVAFDPVRLVLADVVPPLRDRVAVGSPVIGPVEAGVPALLQASKEPVEGGAIATAALPVNQLA